MIVFAVIFSWALLGVALKKRNRRLLRLLNCAALAMAVAVIAYTTLFRAKFGRELILQPFYTVVSAQKNREAYRAALMNVILFIPVGLTLPHVFPRRWKMGARVCLTVAFALLLSVALEAAQYLFYIGTTEIDDVICNTLGAMIGMVQLPISALLQSAFGKKKE